MQTREYDVDLIQCLEEEGFYPKGDFLCKPLGSGTCHVCSIEIKFLSIYDFLNEFRIIVKNKIHTLQLDFSKISGNQSLLKKKGEFFLFLMEQIKSFFNLGLKHGFIVSRYFRVVGLDTIRSGPLTMEFSFEKSFEYGICFCSRFHYCMNLIHEEKYMPDS